MGEEQTTFGQTAEVSLRLATDDRGQVTAILDGERFMLGLKDAVCEEMCRFLAAEYGEKGCG